VQRCSIFTDWDLTRNLIVAQLPISEGLQQILHANAGNFFVSTLPGLSPQISSSTGAQPGDLCTVPPNNALLSVVPDIDQGTSIPNSFLHNQDWTMNLGATTDNGGLGWDYENNWPTAFAIDSSSTPYSHPEPARPMSSLSFQVDMYQPVNVMYCTLCKQTLQHPLSLRLQRLWTSLISLNNQDFRALQTFCEYHTREGTYRRLGAEKRWPSTITHHTLIQRLLGMKVQIEQYLQFPLQTALLNTAVAYLYLHPVACPVPMQMHQADNILRITRAPRFGFG